MNIIRHGDPQAKPEPMIAECRRCKCVFTFEEREAKRCSNNGGGSVYFSDCPECSYSGCAFDTGYHKHPESDAHVKEEHARLRALIPTP